MTKPDRPDIDLEEAEFRRVPKFILVNAREMKWLSAIAAGLAISGAWAGVEKGSLWIVLVALFLAGLSGAFVAGFMSEKDLRKMGIKPKPGGVDTIDE